jgi:hypothetical protein
MTNLEIIDRVTSHLLAQGVRAEDPNASTPSKCRYRHGNLKCAVGFLISDEHYRPQLEGYGVATLEVLRAVEDSLGTSVDEDLLSQLQAVHDTNFPDNWEFLLKEIRDEYVQS